MTSYLTRALGLSLSFIASACSHTMNASDIMQNSHPKMRYEITLTIQDAPGPFESVTGLMQYEVANEECAPRDTFAGVYSKPPIQRIPMTFTRIGEHVYTSAVYLDLMKDEDYYGLGVCHWAMATVIAQLKAKTTVFVPSISSKEIVAQQSVTQYLTKKLYSDTSVEGLPDGGLPMSETVSRYRNEFFSVTLGAKESF